MTLQNIILPNKVVVTALLLCAHLKLNSTKGIPFFSANFEYSIVASLAGPERYRYKLRPHPASSCLPLGEFRVTMEDAKFLLSYVGGRPVKYVPVSTYVEVRMRQLFY